MHLQFVLDWLDHRSPQAPIATVLNIYLMCELLDIFSCTCQQRNFATFLDNRHADRAQRPDPTPAMTAIRTLEFEPTVIDALEHIESCDLFDLIGPIGNV